MSDKELLELAAKAAGISLTEAEWHGDGFYWMPLGSRFWNPLTDDGDALRLAVELRLTVWQGEKWASAHNESADEMVSLGADNNDRHAATRRAIVRAAAEIGRTMK